MKIHPASRAVLALAFSWFACSGNSFSVLAEQSHAGNSYAGPSRAASTQPGWSFREVIHNEGSRSEYTIGHLEYRGAEISEFVQHVIAPIGEFFYLRGEEGSWKPAESPGWQRVMDQPERTTSQAKSVETAFSEEDQARGWYLGGFDARRKGTPEYWFHAPDAEAWIDPQQRDHYELLIVARHKLARLVEAVEEFRRRVGDTPGNLELLVTGPQGSKGWAPIVPRYQLTDPWGRAFEIENYARLHARTEGRSYAIRSKGPDGIEGSGDDLDAPRPVNPKPSFFEGLLRDTES